MSAFVGTTRRVLNSDLYATLCEHGWFHFTPYDVADVMCAINGTTPPALGLQAVQGDDGERVVHTIPLLLALGYGTRRMAFYEWLDRRWSSERRREEAMRRAFWEDATQAPASEKPAEGDPAP